MKKLLGLSLAMVLAMSLMACGADKEAAAPEHQTETEVSVKEETVVSDEAKEEVVKEEISGINDDGMGYDPSYGEGIGEVIALNDEEKTYMVSQTTNTWLNMSQQEKDDLVVLIGRWMEEVTGYIVEDYDDMIAMLDRQSEQYYRNGVNEAIVRTAGDIYSVALPLDDPSLPVADRKPSGINEDGRGYDPNYGEGIGEVISLSEEERIYVKNQNTDSWLQMDQMEKDDFVALIARWLEESHNYIVADFDELVVMLDRQMEQYYRNGVNESVYDTVIDILDIN